MATETLGGLYIRLGLSLSELESDFADAERTMNQNMARLNRQQNLIRLRAEVEIGNLDESADAAQILTVRTRALNEQMAIQRDRIRIATANLQDMTQRHGESAAITQRAAQALERERLQLQRFERELREVESAQRDLNDAQNESSDGINNFSDALDNFAGKVAGLAVVAEVFNTISETVNEANENFKELQNQSFELNLPVGQTKEFLRELKLAGGEIGDFEGYIRGITDAYVKGEFDDPEFIALSKYGAKITDAQGRLKDFASITEEVYQAYLKAKEAGEEIEFLQLTGGESGVRDAIQYFERLKEAKEAAAKVFNADFDAGAYHDLDRTLNVLTEQTDEFKNAIAAIFTPAVQSSAESLFEIFRAGTQFLTENKEEFKSWGFIAAEVINSVLDPLKELKTSLEDTKIGDNSVFGALKDTAKNFVGNIAIGPSRILYKMADAIGLTSDLTARANEKQIEYNNSIKEASKSWADFQKEQEKSAARGNPLNLYDTKRITQYQDELADLRIELDYADDEYAKAIAQADLWLQRELTRKNYLSSDEEIAIRELHAAKIEQIEREKAERIADIRENAARARRTDLENTLADIENERDSWIKQGIDPERATAFAEEQRYQALTELEESFSQRINEIRGNDLENQLARIEQEKQAWIDKGIEESRAEELAAAQKIKILTDYADKQQQDLDRYAEQEQQRQKQIAEAIEDYWKRVAESIERQFDEALSVLKSQLDAFRAYRDKGLKGLEEYERKQLKKQGITDKDLQSMTKDNLDDFKQAQKDVKRRLLPNFQPVNDVPFPELPPPIKLPKAFDDLNGTVYQTRDALNSFKDSLLSGDYKAKDDPGLYRLAGLAESEGRKNWLFQNDTRIENGELRPISHFADEKAFKDAREGLDYFNRDIPNYNPAPDFDPELDLKNKLASLFGDLAGNGITDEFGNVVKAFDEEISGMTQELKESTEALSNMTSRVAQVDTPRGLNQPANVNVTVQIEEAHAWDSQHIQELSDRVADNIQPAIINAIGGDSNGY